jgi:hypothetical protein
MKYLFLLFCSSFYGQVLHHQMISSQGKSSVLSNGIRVKQTIGQQSVSGNSKGDYIVQQGFQQNRWTKILAETQLKSDLTVITYPNPFVADVNFEFSKPITKEVLVTIFDISGRLVFQRNQTVKDRLLTIDLSMLSGSVYLVRLTNNEVNYYIKITKYL